jgi:hypothetical protein
MYAPSFDRTLESFLSFPPLIHPTVTNMQRVSLGVSETPEVVYPPEDEQVFLFFFIKFNRKIESSAGESMFIFSRIKKRRKSKVKLVTLLLCEVKKNRSSFYEKVPTCAA